MIYIVEGRVIRLNGVNTPLSHFAQGFSLDMSRVGFVE